MTVGSLFSGIGGFDLGLERAGFSVVFQVESDPFCRKVLAKHWPNLPRKYRWEDIREFCRPISKELAEGYAHVDLLVGGFPCQDLSVAGKRKGLSGAYSGLFFEIVRIAQEIKPAWGLFENVPRASITGSARRARPIRFSRIRPALRFRGSRMAACRR